LPVHQRRKGAAQEPTAINGRWRRTTFRLNFFGSLVESTADGGVWLVHLAVFGLGAHWVFDGQPTV
jgi:ATP-binding cassette subfamily B protein